MRAEGLPIFAGTLGVHNNSFAIKITDWIRRAQSSQLRELVTLQSPAGGRDSTLGQ
jgi:flagellar motor switch protein FliM